MKIPLLSSMIIVIVPYQWTSWQRQLLPDALSRGRGKKEQEVKSPAQNSQGEGVTRTHTWDSLARTWQRHGVGQGQCLQPRHSYFSWPSGASFPGSSLCKCSLSLCYSLTSCGSRATVKEKVVKWASVPRVDDPWGSHLSHLNSFLICKLRMISWKISPLASGEHVPPIIRW